MLPTLFIENYLERSLDNLCMDILGAPKVIAGDIKLRDLAATAQHPFGVYVFADQIIQGRCLYVGKVSSRSFAERIPMHFDPRAKAWMNQFTRKLSVLRYDGDYQTALLYALNQYIIFVGFQFSDHDDENIICAKSINALEAVLRTYLKPALNTLARKRACDGTCKVHEFLP